MFDWYVERGGKKGGFMRASLDLRLAGDMDVLEVLIKADLDRRPFEDVMYALWRDVVCASGEHRERAELFFSSGLQVAAQRSKAPRKLLRLKEGRIHDQDPDSYTLLEPPGLQIESFNEAQIQAVLAKPLRALLRRTRARAKALKRTFAVLPGEDVPAPRRKKKRLPFNAWVEELLNERDFRTLF